MSTDIFRRYIDIVSESAPQSVTEMDKSQPSHGRDGHVSHSTYGSRDKEGSDYFKGKESPVKPISVKQMEKDALDILKKQGVAEGTYWAGSEGPDGIAIDDPNDVMPDKKPVAKKLGPKAKAKTQMLKMYGDGEITFRKTSNGGYFIQHEDDFGDTHSHQYDPKTGKVDFSGVTRSTYYGKGVAEGIFDFKKQPMPEHGDELKIGDRYVIFDDGGSHYGVSWIKQDRSEAYEEFNKSEYTDLNQLKKAIWDEIKYQDQRGVAEGSVTPDVSVDKIYDDGNTKEWHIYRGEEMIGFVWKNLPDTAEGLYIASGHGPGRGYTEEFTGLKSAVNFIANLDNQGVAEGLSTSRVWAKSAQEAYKMLGGKLPKGFVVNISVNDPNRVNTLASALQSSGYTTEPDDSIQDNGIRVISPKFEGGQKAQAAFLKLEDLVNRLGGEMTSGVSIHTLNQQGVAEGKVSGYKMYSNHDGTWYVEDENENVVLRNASKGEAEHAVWSGNKKLKQGMAEGTKSLADYIAESERAYSKPVTGDYFAINIREETLFETWVCDETPDGIVIYADDQGMALLEHYGYLGEPVMEMHHINDYEADSDGSDVDVVDRGEYDYEGDQARDQLQSIVRAARRLNGIIDDDDNLPEWVQMKITKAEDYIDTAADYMESNREQGVAEGFPHDVDHMPGPRIKNPQTGCKRCHGKGYVYKTADGKVLPSNEQGAKRYKCRACGGIGFVKQGVAEGDMDEAKYQGREVPLGKPMAGDVKKSKVYVRGPKGNVVKVNFGQKGMKIKKNIPGRRKNFRARHNCDNPGPRWKARYWSCRAW